jgi:hypothetical protein
VAKPQQRFERCRGVWNRSSFIVQSSALRSRVESQKEKFAEGAIILLALDKMTRLPNYFCEVIAYRKV